MSRYGFLQAAVLLVAASGGWIALRARVDRTGARLLVALLLAFAIGSSARLLAPGALAPLALACDAGAAVLGVVAAVRAMRPRATQLAAPAPTPASDTFLASRRTLHDLRNALSVVGLASAQLRSPGSQLDAEALESLEMLENAARAAGDLGRELGKSSAAARVALARPAREPLGVAVELAEAGRSQEGPPEAGVTER